MKHSLFPLKNTTKNTLSENHFACTKELQWQAEPTDLNHRTAGCFSASVFTSSRTQSREHGKWPVRGVAHTIETAAGCPSGEHFHPGQHLHQQHRSSPLRAYPWPSRSQLQCSWHHRAALLTSARAFLSLCRSMRFINSLLIQPLFVFAFWQGCFNWSRHPFSLTVAHIIAALTPPSQKRLLVTGRGERILLQQPPAPKSGSTTVQPHPENSLYEAALRHLPKSGPQQIFSPSSEGRMVNVSQINTDKMHLSVSHWFLRAGQGRWLWGWEEESSTSSAAARRAAQTHSSALAQLQQAELGQSTTTNKRTWRLKGPLTRGKVMFSLHPSLFPLFYWKYTKPTLT